MSSNGAELVRCARGGSVGLHGTSMFAANSTPQMVNFVDEPLFNGVAVGVRNNNPNIALTNHPEWLETISKS